jgi:hypothetical protein
MLFRDHPLMKYRGVLSWPPVWMWVDDLGRKHALGEVGVLQRVLPADVEPADRCFLFIDYSGSTYVGCLLIDNPAFCDRLVELLQGCYNRRIAEIGSMDVSHFFEGFKNLSRRF